MLSRSASVKIPQPRHGDRAGVAQGAGHEFPPPETVSATRTGMGLPAASWIRGSRAYCRGILRAQMHQVPLRLVDYLREQPFKTTGKPMAFAASTASASVSASCSRGTGMPCGRTCLGCARQVNRPCSRKRLMSSAAREDRRQGAGRPFPLPDLLVPQGGHHGPGLFRAVQDGISCSW